MLALSAPQVSCLPGRLCACLPVCLPACAPVRLLPACLPAVHRWLPTSHTLCPLLRNKAPDVISLSPTLPCSLLLLGFVVPTLYIWCSEVRMRVAFLRQRGCTLPPQLQPSLSDYLMFGVPAGE